MDMASVIQWCSTVTSAVAVSVVTTILKRSERKMDRRHEEHERVVAQEEEWRNGMTDRIGGIEESVGEVKEATRATMKQALMHNAEIYVTRGWATLEERAALYEMYQRYTLLGTSGYVDAFIRRVLELPTDPPHNERG